MEYRRARIEDAENLFMLKNDEDVRRFAINKQVIDWDLHIYWLLKNMKNIWIILADSNEFAGDLRIDNKELSIRLLKKYRGKGLGSKAIKKFAKRGYTAKIVDGNIASMRIFVKSGFNFIDYKDGVYTLCV